MYETTAFLCNAVLLILPLVSLYFAVSEGVSLGATCTDNANCTIDDMNSECISGTCQCSEMFFQQNNTCVAKLALEAPCDDTNQCKDINAICTGTCTCNEAYYPDTDWSYPNMACLTAINASCVANAYCNSTNFCVCGIGYTATTTSCILGNSAVTIAVVDISTIIMCFLLAYIEVLSN